MKHTLRPGLEGTYRYRVPESKTVPRIYPEAPDFQMMPGVLATGYLVALAEWACIELVKPHLDWPREQTLGTHVSLSHVAATPPGFTVEIRSRLEAIEGRKLVFAVSAHDGVDTISEGTHERHVIEAARFAAKLAAKSRAPRMNARAWIAALALGAAALALPAAAQKAPPAAPMEISSSELPGEARATLALIRKGGPFPYAKDGAVFRNRERSLPIQKRGYYREYTVKTPGERTRGARRIIAGRGGEFFYTGDHYNHFRRIRE